MTDTPTDVDVELERAYDRDDLADVFRAFATALEDGAPVRIEGDDASATVTVPPRVALELELEREREAGAERDGDAEFPVAGLEFELEWDEPGPNDSSVRPATDADGTSLVIGRDVQRPADRSSDSAMATMPADGVPGTPERGEPEQGSGRDVEGDSATAGGSEPADRSTGAGRTIRFEIYEDRAEEWRWRLVHWNGNIIADSGEGYASRSNAKRAVRSVMRTAPTAAIANTNTNPNRDDRG